MNLIAYEAVWQDVNVGHYVKDLNGKTWKVTDYIFEGHWLLKDRDSKEVRLPLQPALKPVTILVDPKQLIERMLDGTEIK